MTEVCAAHWLQYVLAADTEPLLAGGLAQVGAYNEKS
jgi:hypothetical protein